MKYVIEERIGGIGIDGNTGRSDEEWREAEGVFVQTTTEREEHARKQYAVALEELPPSTPIRLVCVLEERKP